ncbi:hypothetical protein [Actinomadura logoneensis]|uniref:hypothetical protein n=1 Tax=Actinomadura logoneensis TaxID=2293572 RepID=UPI0018F2458D|nr:hypothetical protein [Actinomadura logoneensis]
MLPVATLLGAVFLVVVNLATRTADRPNDVLTPEFIAEVFGVRAHIGPHPLTGRPHIAIASPA